MFQKLILFPLLLSLFVSCIKQEQAVSIPDQMVTSRVPITETKFAAQAKTLLDKFNLQYGTNFPISRIFSSSTRHINGSVGICRNHTDIYLDPNVSRVIFSAVLIHELGHCALNLGHDSTLTKNGHKSSIMNPVADAYNALRMQYYLEHIFDKDDDKLDEIMEREAFNDTYNVINALPNVVLNPNCELLNGQVICPEGAVNSIRYNQSSIYGYTQCGGTYFYIKDLSIQEKEVCDEWKDVIEFYD